eukprot:4074074-Pyramimonas_sp.AAC.2
MHECSKTLSETELSGLDSASQWLRNMAVQVTSAMSWHQAFLRYQTWNKASQFPHLSSLSVKDIPANNGPANAEETPGTASNRSMPRYGHCPKQKPETSKTLSECAHDCR